MLLVKKKRRGDGEEENCIGVMWTTTPLPPAMLCVSLCNPKTKDGRIRLLFGNVANKPRFPEI